MGEETTRILLIDNQVESANRIRRAFNHPKELVHLTVAAVLRQARAQMAADLPHLVIAPQHLQHHVLAIGRSILQARAGRLSVPPVPITASHFAQQCPWPKQGPHEKPFHGTHRRRR